MNIKKKKNKKKSIIKAAKTVEKIKSNRLISNMNNNDLTTNTINVSKIKNKSLYYYLVTHITVMNKKYIQSLLKKELKKYDAHNFLDAEKVSIAKLSIYNIYKNSNSELLMDINFLCKRKKRLYIDMNSIDTIKTLLAGTIPGILSTLLVMFYNEANSMNDSLAITIINGYKNLLSAVPYLKITKLGDFLYAFFLLSATTIGAGLFFTFIFWLIYTKTVETNIFKIELLKYEYEIVCNKIENMLKNSISSDLKK